MFNVNTVTALDFAVQSRDCIIIMDIATMTSPILKPRVWHFGHYHLAIFGATSGHIWRKGWSWGRMRGWIWLRNRGHWLLARPCKVAANANAICLVTRARNMKKKKKNVITLTLALFTFTLDLDWIAAITLTHALTLQHSMANAGYQPSRASYS